jgi:hypothetical protein
MSGPTSRYDITTNPYDYSDNPNSHENDYDDDDYEHYDDDDGDYDDDDDDDDSPAGAPEDPCYFEDYHRCNLLGSLTYPCAAAAYHASAEPGDTPWHMLGDEVKGLLQTRAENVLCGYSLVGCHDAESVSMRASGWTLGLMFSPVAKISPYLVLFHNLPPSKLLADARFADTVNFLYRAMLVGVDKY